MDEPMAALAAGHLSDSARVRCACGWVHYRVHVRDGDDLMSENDTVCRSYLGGAFLHGHGATAHGRL